MNAIEPTLLLLDKPIGLTSFDTLKKVKKILNRNDIGHGGTLDRFASGLLPVFIGQGLKLVRFCQENYPNLPTYWKTYTGEISLGSSRDTGDDYGQTLETKTPPALTVEKIQSAMNEFIGQEYLQTPPHYSAKKVNGQRSSDLARKGTLIELKPVLVHIEQFNCTAFNPELNTIQFSVKCSKGTYVRVLAEDLAKKLETLGYLNALRRTAVGTWNIDQAYTLETLQTADLSTVTMSLSQASRFLPEFEISTEETSQLLCGQTMDTMLKLANSGLSPNVYLLTSSAQDTPVALMELTAQKRVQYLRGFVTSQV